MGGLLSEGFVTLISVQRELDGKVWDYATQKWLPPTPESLAAADAAVIETVGAVVDLIPFPIQTSVLGVINLSVSRAAMDAAIAKIQSAVKVYVAATRIM
jgi:hypothetical protein